MELTKITSLEFKKFVNSSDYLTFHQDERWGQLKEESGWDYELVGLKDKDKIVAATMLLYKKTYFNILMCYSPRGFIMDYSKKNLLEKFTLLLKKYLKEKNVTFLKLDPYIIYNLRDSDGNIVEENPSARESFSIFTKLGYEHHGFNLDISNELQPRWIYRLSLEKEYEDLEKNFSKSTRKNISSSKSKGVKVRKATVEDLDVIVDILKDSSVRKNFILRGKKYYHDMMVYLDDMIAIYLAYIDTKVYFRYAKESLDNELNNNRDLESKLKTEKVGNKLRNLKETSDRLIVKYQAELKNAEELMKEYPEGKDIGALVSLHSPKELLSLNSGMLDEYRSFTPKYALYEKHIKDALIFRKEYSNFYGISGIFTKENNPMYGVYEFKKGFSGEVIELIGEFDLPISNFKFKLYKFLFKVYKRFKKK